MGRFFVGILVVVAVIPAIGLAKLWLDASRNRQVDRGAISLYETSEEAARSTQALVRRRSRSSYLGVLAGILADVALAIVVGSTSVFFWFPIVVLGGLIGVLAGTALPVRSYWPLVKGRRDVPVRPIAVAMRVAVAIALATSALGYFTGSANDPLEGCVVGRGSAWPTPPMCLYMGVAVAVSWLLGETALGLVGRARHIPADGSDVTVDDAARSAVSHTAIGATTLVSLGSLSVAGLGLGLSAASASCSNGGSLGTVLITVGLAASIAALLIAGFLIQWGIQLRSIADQVRHAVADSHGSLGR